MTYGGQERWRLARDACLETVQVCCQNLSIVGCCLENLGNEFTPLEFDVKAVPSTFGIVVYIDVSSLCRLSFSGGP